MDSHTAYYLVRYFGHFMTKREHLAHKHLLGTLKVSHGRSDVAAQIAAKARRHQLKDLFSNDPEVLSLASEGFEAFQLRTAKRIFENHREEIFLNYCRRCGALARTPKAKQCRLCGYDWHKL